MTHLIVKAKTVYTDCSNQAPRQGGEGEGKGVYVHPLFRLKFILFNSIQSGVFKTITN